MIMTGSTGKSTTLSTNAACPPIPTPNSPLHSHHPTPSNYPTQSATCLPATQVLPTAASNVAAPRAAIIVTNITAAVLPLGQPLLVAVPAMRLAQLATREACTAAARICTSPSVSQGVIDGRLFVSDPRVAGQTPTLLSHARLLGLNSEGDFWG